LKKENRSIISGGVCSMYLQYYIKVISFFKRGEIIQRKIKGIQTGEVVAPRRAQARGSAPRCVNVYAIIIVLCISIDKSIIRTRSLRNTHSQETHIYPRKPSRGRKPSKNFLIINC
jgi:hypothetical protein